MSRRGTNIYKRKDGRWEGRYIKGRSDGRIKYGYVYAHTYKEAKEKLVSAKRKTDNDIISNIKAGNTKNISNRWICDACTRLKPSTRVKYEDLLRCYILPSIGDIEFSQVTNDDIIRLVANLTSNGGAAGQGLSSSTVSEVVTILRELRQYVLKRGYMVNYTTECITVRQEGRNIRIMSKTEESSLIGYLNENMSTTSLGILIALYTGIRIGELCALKWDDIDLTNEIMHVTKTMIRLRIEPDSPIDSKTRVMIIDAKTASSKRVIPIPRKLFTLMRTYYKPGAYILSGLPDVLIEPRTMQNRFKNIIKGIEIYDINFHVLRHTFATRCVEAGFDIKSLSEILGHSSVAITMNRYVHPTLEHKAANMEKLSDLMM